MALGVVALLLVWLGTRPYLGVRHDASFYVVQALAWLEPDRFRDDLFFAFGSQDSFTIFSLLYAPLIASLGLVPAHGVLLVTGHLLWLAGAGLLVAAVVEDRQIRFWALAAVIALPGVYGAFGVIRYGEGFVTPRLFAEALVLAALAFGLRGRVVLAMATLAAAALLHPLMALPGLGVLLTFVLLGRRRFAVVALTLAGLVLAALASLPAPWLQSLGRLDEAWFAAIAARSPFVLVLEWRLADAVRLLVQLILGVIALLLLDGPARRLAGAALLVWIAGLLATLAGGDLARLQIVVAGQPWRAGWLAVLIINLLLVPALLRLRATGFGTAATGWPPVILALLAYVLAGAFPVLLFACLPLLMVAALNILLHRARIVPAVAGHLALRTLLVVAAVWALALTWYLIQSLRADLSETTSPAVRQILLVLAGGAVLAASSSVTAMRTGRAAAVWTAALLTAGAALAMHDQRPSWERFIETPGAEHAALQAFAPPASRIFWDGALDVLWLRLGQPSYFSCRQGAGLAFFRETATAFAQRAESLRFQRFEGTCFASLTPRDEAPAVADLVRACRREPSLDHIILHDRIADLVADSFYLPAGRMLPGDARGGRVPPGFVYRYDCAALRADARFAE